MYKLFFSVFLLLAPASFALASSVEQQKAAFSAALEDAAVPAATFYQPSFVNKEEEFLYKQVFNFLLLFPPQGKKSVFDLRQKDVPHAHIYVYIAPSAELRKILRAGGQNPDLVLPASTNGVTLPMVERTTGFKKLIVLIASDLILGKETLTFPLSEAKREEFLAKLSALLAHEIYGHSYLYAFDPRRDIPRKEQEVYAYKQSSSFLARIAAHPELKQRPALVKALQKAREEEEYFLRLWNNR